MKKSLFSNIFKFAMFFMAATIMFTACKDDDDDDDPVVVVLDGYYVMGDATTLTSPVTDGKMKVTRNEVGQADRVSLVEKYIALKGNESFSITKVAGAVRANIAPGTDFALVTEFGDAEPQGAPFWRGSYTEGDGTFTVPEDGLYHIVIDEELMKIVIARVKWAIIGDATANGWSDSYLDPSDFNQTNMSFSQENMRLLTGKIKFRYSGGWKIEIDDAGEVKVNTNFGEDVSSLVPGGNDIVWSAPGFYTVTMNWSLANGTTAVLTKTGDVDPVDYTNIQYGLRGDGIMNADTAWSWSVDYMPHLPVVSGTDYTYTWNNVKLKQGGGFKIHGVENDQWLGVSAMSIEGDADGILGGGDNFEPQADTTVNLTFLIKAAEFKNTLTISAATK